MTNKTALVTGAGRGIGRGIAIELARHGFNIAALATSADPANHDKGLYEVKDRIEELGRGCLPIAADIASLADHPRILREAVDAFGGIDVMVNNAGVAPLVRMDLLETTPESFDRVMNINLRGPLFLTQLVANHMITQKSGEKPVIVFITSISAATASPNRAEYCISKSGLSMAAQNFAVRLADYGINVFELRPGVIKTDMTATVQQKYDKMFADKAFLQNRWGTPEDVGKAVSALALGYFGYSTGAVIEIGGGFGVSRL